MFATATIMAATIGSASVNVDGTTSAAAMSIQPDKAQREGGSVKPYAQPDRVEQRADEHGGTDGIPRPPIDAMLSRRLNGDDQASETAYRDRQHHCGEPQTLLAGTTDPADPGPPPADDGPHERDEEDEIRDVDHPDAPVTRVGLPL